MMKKHLEPETPIDVPIESNEYRLETSNPKGPFATHSWSDNNFSLVFWRISPWDKRWQTWCRHDIDIAFCIADHLWTKYAGHWRIPSRWFTNGEIFSLTYYFVQPLDKHFHYHSSCRWYEAATYRMCHFIQTVNGMYNVARFLCC